MNKWIAEFDLEDGDTMPEHMDFNYKGTKIDFYCRPIWTPCSERPPKENEFYLATIHVLEINCDFCEKLFYGDPEYPNTDGVGWYFLLYDNETVIKINGVTAWMPLPKPWKGENGE